MSKIHGNDMTPPEIDPEKRAKGLVKEGLLVIRGRHNRVKTGRMAPFIDSIPEKKKQHEERYDAYYLKLNSDLHTYIENHAENDHIVRAVNSLVALFSEMPYLHLKRGVNNMCTLLADDPDPVLVRSAVYHFVDEDGWFDNGDEPLGSSVIPRIKKVLRAITKDLDMSTISETPFDMVNILLRDRFVSEFGDLVPESKRGDDENKVDEALRELLT